MSENDREKEYLQTINYTLSKGSGPRIGLIRLKNNHIMRSKLKEFLRVQVSLSMSTQRTDWEHEEFKI